jgi:hypothetical protein
MYFKFVVSLFLISYVLFLDTDKPIHISKVGDNWNQKVDSAILLIKLTDKNKYEELVNNCDTIDFSFMDFSTTELPRTIVISNKDINLNSINNLAAVLVHESHHLYLYNTNNKSSADEEELNCYLYEYDFLTKLPEIEDWLFINNVEKIIYYQNRIKK